MIDDPHSDITRARSKVPGGVPARSASQGQTFRRFLEGLSDLVLEVDDTGAVIWANHIATSFFGDEITGTGIESIFVRDDGLLREVEQFCEGRVNEVEALHWQRRADGRQRLLSWTLGRFDSLYLGEPLRLATATDVTASENTLLDEEEYALKRSRSLQHQKMQAIGELVGGIAHEFNNTLTTIMGYTELSLLEADTRSNSKLKTYLREAYEGGKRARDLVARMLMFSRPDDIHAVSLDLDDIIKGSVKILRATLPSSIRISIDCDDDLPTIVADKSLINLLIMNVCINARDAMQDVGAIYVRARVRKDMHSHCASCHDGFSGDFVELAIEDSGPGISPDVQDRIFEPYVSTRSAGSGMGLSVVHGILHKQGGHVLMDTIVGDGTEFRFYFRPETTQDRQVRDEVEPIERISRDPDNSAVHILVAEDETSLVYFLRELLQRQGYQVTVACDGDEAWGIFSRDPDRFAMVITDQAMPGITGTQLAQKLVQLRPGLPVLLCTGYSDIVREKRALSAGVSSLLSKPIDTRKFLTTVQDLLDAPGAG